jgi:hypothetical protein
MTQTTFTAVATYKLSRDEKTLTRIVTVRDEAGTETDRRTSKTSDYVAIRVIRENGHILSAHKTLAAAVKAQNAGEYGFNSATAVVVEVTGREEWTFGAARDGKYVRVSQADPTMGAHGQISRERRVELSAQAVREVAEAAVELDLHEQWRQADRMARLHNRHARQGREESRELAREARELAARLAKQIRDAGGDNPRGLRWK